MDHVLGSFSSIKNRNLNILKINDTKKWHDIRNTNQSWNQFLCVLLSLAEIHR